MNTVRFHFICIIAARVFFFITGLVSIQRSSVRIPGYGNIPAKMPEGIAVIFLLPVSIIICAVRPVRSIVVLVRALHLGIIFIRGLVIEYVDHNDLLVGWSLVPVVLRPGLRCKKYE